MSVGGIRIAKSPGPHLSRTQADQRDVLCRSLAAAVVLGAVGAATANVGPGAHPLTNTYRELTCFCMLSSGGA